ncbi:hypothetical protein LCGC14_1302640 [marine sediment metagenome]|uniref:Uncharacterized protein n=1 Tax=marine sediment metagenome TaxID=412755 RepID=A0A0F9KPH6_9ZZZZ
MGAEEVLTVISNVGIWRLLKAVGRSRQRLGLDAQRRRLVRSIVAHEERRRVDSEAHP